MGRIIAQEKTDRFWCVNADCMEVFPEIKSETVGFTVYSPPFPELYQYSNDPRDMSNCTTYDEGLAQYRFIVDQLYRVTKPGRLTAVHCMDLKRGQFFQRDFPGDIVRVHQDAGFGWVCRVTIWKDPWLIARRTRMRSLMHKSIVNDSAACRIAGPDYVLIFKKPGENFEPIEHPHGLYEAIGGKFAGEQEIPPHLIKEFANYRGDQKKNYLSHWIWRQYASPVWSDIRSGRLLKYKEAKENPEEAHVCALQLDVIERCLTLWSNPDDIVLTPFMGVGSEVYCSIINGRRAIGIELKESYYRQALANVQEGARFGREGEQVELDLDGVGTPPDDATMD